MTEQTTITIKSFYMNDSVYQMEPLRHLLYVCLAYRQHKPYWHTHPMQSAEIDRVTEEIICLCNDAGIVPCDAAAIDKSLCCSVYSFSPGHVGNDQWYDYHQKWFQEFNSIIDQLLWDAWHRAIAGIASGNNSCQLAQHLARIDNVFRRQLWVEREKRYQQQQIANLREQIAALRSTNHHLLAQNLSN